MTLIIEGWLNEEFEKETRRIEWHLGEPLPNFSHVVKFQADGDELNLFIQAMHLSQDYRGGIRYTKTRGFYPAVPTCPRCGTQKINCQNGCTWPIE